MLNENFVIVGSLIASIGAIAYFIDVLKGKIRPNRVSFLLWSVGPFIIFLVQIKQGIGWPAFVSFMSAFWTFMVFIASYVNKKAEWKLTPFDLWCGILSAVGLMFWFTTKNGNVAILFSILADGFATIPTLIKAYSHPETELAWPWLTPVVGMVLTFFTLKQITFASSGYIVYVFIVNIIIFTFIYLGVKKRKAKKIRKKKSV